MPVKQDSNDFWAQQMLQNLEQNRTLFAPAPIVKKASLNELDGALQDLLAVSAQLDRFGMELTSEAVLKVAQTMINEANGEQDEVASTAIETPAPALPDLETEVNKNV